MEERKDQQAMDQVPEEPQGEGQVTLTVEQYKALMEKLEGLEKKLGEKSSKSPDEPLDLDYLVREAYKQPPAPQEPQVDLEELTVPELVEYTIRQVQEQLIAPLYQEILAERYTRQVKETAQEFEDFWDHADEVKKVCLANPGMTVRQAYLLVKAQKGEFPTPKGKGEKKVAEREAQEEGEGERVVTLPKRRPPSGEKPGVPGSTVKTATPETIREAALRAMEELGIED